MTQYAAAILLLFFFCSPVFAQEFKYPVIPSSGHGIKDFIPKGWFALDTAYGDLNKDNKTDIALILQCSDSNNIIHNTGGLGVDILDTNPRILLILFYNSSDQSYTLKLQHNTFILNWDDPVLDDPFAEITIEHGTIKISFTFWASAGSWSASNTTYQFQWLDNDFKLIGAEDFSYERNTGNSRECSYNFLTKRKKITTERNISNDENNPIIRTNTKWEKLKLKQLRSLSTFIEPYTWHIGNIEL